MSWQIISQGEKKKEVKSRQTALISPVKMEGRGNSGSFGGTFNKLICEEDAGADEQPPYSNQEKQQGTAIEKWIIYRVHQQEPFFVSC